MKIEEEIVQKRLEAYNERDISKFMSCYSRKVKLYNFDEVSPFVNGVDELKKMYTQIFSDSPYLKASIKSRIIFDNKIIDEEDVVGKKGGFYEKLVIIYEVKSDLIDKVTFIREKN